MPNPNSTTPYLSLTAPGQGTIDWDAFINGDLSILDSFASSVATQLSGAVSINGSAGSIVITAGNNITLSQNLSIITINAQNQSIQTQNIVNINGSSGSIVITAGNNVTLTQNLSSITINVQAQTIQTQNIVNINGSSGSISLVAGNNITLSQNNSTITVSGANIPAQTNQTIGLYASSQTVGQVSSSTIDARSLSFVGEGNISVGISAGSFIISGSAAQAGGVNVSLSGNTSGALALISSGTMILAGGNNITLSQNGQSVTISGPNTVAQTVQTQNLVSINGSTGNISFVAGANISLSQNASTVTISASNAPTQTNQTIGIYASSQTVGQSSSSTIDARSLSLVGQGIISAGMSAGSLLISATTVQSVQTQNLHVDIIGGNTAGATASVSSGTLTLAGGNNITLSQAGNAITISGPNTAAQSVQTQNLVDVSLSGNTAGALALISSGTAIFAGGNNITLSQNGQSITISGANAAGAQTGISSIIVSNTTYTSGAVSFSNANGISFGSSAGQAITASYTVPTQTVQTIGLYASSQTVGQSSSSTIDARSFTHVGQGIISVGLSAGSLLISATTVQSNQSLGIYASSQTIGQSSSSTIDARSATFVGQGIISVGLSAGSVLISASAAQTVQTQNCVDVSLSGNTAGALALVSSGTLILAGGNNIVLSQNGQSVTISGPNTIAQTNQTLSLALSSQTVGNTSGISVDARSLTLQGMGAVSVGASTSAGGTSILISAPNTIAQTNQTLSLAATSNTAGNTSGLSVDARSISFAGYGAASVGFSTSAGGSSIIVSVPTVVAQTNQTIGIYASSQTIGQSSSSTIDARSFTHVGQGIISVGMSAGSLLISATTAAQTVQTQNLVDVSLSGNTSGALALVSSGTLILAGGNNITLSQNGQTVTISGPNAAGAQTGISAVVVSNTTYTSGTISFVNSNGISFGSSGAQGISASYTVPTQTNQTLSFAITGNTTGNTSGFSVDARSLTVQGLGIISAGISTSAGGSSLILSATTAAQTNQTIGIYASSQTVGQSSSSTLDARSLSIVGQGNISVGLSAGSFIISQTGAGAGGIAASLSGNTAGALALISSGTMILAGGNNIVLSQNGQSVTISGPNTVAQSAQTIGVYGSSQTVGQSSSSTIDARSVTFVGQGIVSVGMSGGSVLLSATTNAQTNQTLGLYVSSQTYGQSSSSTIDARSLTIVGQGNVTVGLSAGSLLISNSNGGGAGDGYNIVSMFASTSGGGTLGATFSTLSGSIGLLAGSNITLSQTSNTINIIGPAAYTGSFFEPEVYGNTTSMTNAQGTVYFSPFFVNEALTIDRILILQQMTSQSATTASISASVSAGNASSGTGSWGMTGTVLLFSRQSLNVTSPNNASIVSASSATYSYGVGYSQSVSWSTNVSSCTASYTTSAAISFVSNINSTGGFTTGSFGTSSNGSFSSTSTNANSFSSSFIMSFASQVLSQVRPIQIPFGGLLTPGDYWLAQLQSTNTGSTNYALQRVCQMNSLGLVYYTTNTSGFADIGSSASNQTSNLKWGIGSYGTSANTTTAIGLSQISAMSNMSLYFILNGQTK